MAAVPGTPQPSATARAFRHAFDGPLFRRLAVGGVRLFPPWWNFAVMPVWGGLFSALVPAARRAAEHNLERVLGPMSPLERRRRSLRLFTNYAQSVANLYALHLDLPLGIEASAYRADLLTELRRDKRGAVLVTGHMGYWQIAPFLMADKAYPQLTMAMAEEPNRRAAEFEEKFRKRLRIVYLTRGPLAFVELARLIGEGELVGMQLDRHAGGASLMVDFFGRPAPFPTSPALLARATGAPMIPAFVLATTDRRRCEFFIEDPIHVAKTRDRDRDVGEALEKLVAVYARYVAAYPEQWFNFFDFWATPPAPAASEAA